MEIPEANRNQVHIASTCAEVEKICEVLLAEAKAQCYGENDLFGIHLALEEALMNAAKHGNGLDPAKKVYIEYCVTPEKFEVCITDQGEGFI